MGRGTRLRSEEGTGSWTGKIQSQVEWIGIIPHVLSGLVGWEPPPHTSDTPAVPSCLVFSCHYCLGSGTPSMVLFLVALNVPQGAELKPRVNRSLQTTHKSVAGQRRLRTSPFCQHLLSLHPQLQCLPPGCQQSPSGPSINPSSLPSSILYFTCSECIPHPLTKNVFLKSPWWFFITPRIGSKLPSETSMAVPA